MQKAFRFVLLCMLIIVLTISFAISRADEEKLYVYYLDVGQADASIIICNEKVMMIDGGNAADSSLIYSMIRNTLKIDHIDYIIATHPHEDHIGGLSAAFNACTVDTLYTPTLDYDTKSFLSLIKYAIRGETKIIIPNSGDSFSLGTARVEILAPLRNYSNNNDMSIVAMIFFGKTKFLFTGDIEWEAEHDLVNSEYDLSADVLKVSHHGSNNSSCYLFLREVMPSYAVVSVGKRNPYGHPSEEALSRLQDSNAIVLRTDELGTIECISDGNSIIFPYLLCRRE